MDMGVSATSTRATQSSSTSSTTNTTLGKDDFLKLLMVQLQNQDPTNTVDNNAMLAQLAQFSALEQQQRTADLMETMLEITQRNEQLTAANYIGKTVRAKGYELSKEGSEVSTVYYSSNETIHSGKIYVYGPDGDIVYTEEIGSKQAGFYEFTWNGKNSAGKDMPDGQYTVAIQAKTEAGNTVLVHTEVSGKVISAVTENGSTYLRLKDGRVVPLDNVYEVYDPSLVSSTEQDSSNSGSSGSTGNEGSSGSSGNTEGAEDTDNGTSGDTTEESTDDENKGTEETRRRSRL